MPAAASRRRTRTFPPHIFLPEEARGSFGNGAELDWLAQTKLLPKGIDPAQALAAAMWQHLVVYGLRVALEDRGWSEKDLAAKTPGVGYQSWANVMSGRTLIRADHIGAATIALGSSGFLPPVELDTLHKSAHASRLPKDTRAGFAESWDAVATLQDGWLGVRDSISRSTGAVEDDWSDPPERSEASPSV